MASGMATRCTSCGTVFRVVADQLRVSEGWVRCGRCAEVFNASEALLDLDTGAPRGTPTEAPRAMVTFGGVRDGGSAPPAGPPPAMADFGLKPTRRDREQMTPATRPEPEPEHDAVPTMDEAVSRFAADAAEPGAALSAGEADPASADDIAAGPRSQRVSAGGYAKPRFMRQAERAARWRQPRVRAALAATVVLGAAGLIVQIGLTYRDLVAARFPALRPVLQAACAPLGCSVGPAQLIDSLVVESSGLVRVEKSTVYRLSVVLRNRAALEVALPALELALTDGQGQLVARRVLSTRELGVNQATLGAGRELQLQATLQAATAPVAGYTVDLFYP